MIQNISQEHGGYLGSTFARWNKLGGVIPESASINTWAENAGMNYEILPAPAHVIEPSTGQVIEFPRIGLYRSDNFQPLSVMGKNYKIVQPREVLEFFDNLAHNTGWRIERAGVMKGGSKYWAFATNETTGELSHDDKVGLKMLLFSSCDGSSATTAVLTTLSFVCFNQLNAMFGEGLGQIKIYHSSKFVEAQIAEKLGFNDVFNSFMAHADRLASHSMSDSQTKATLMSLYGKYKDDEYKKSKSIQNVLTLFKTTAKGCELTSRKNTAWGLLNAITEHTDHYAASRSDENRSHSAMFGNGNNVKNKAHELLYKLAA